MLFVPSEDVVYRSFIGTSASKMMTSNFKKFEYDSLKWVIYISDSKTSFDVNAPNYELYPKVKKGSNGYYYYYVSDSKYYTYRWTSGGKLIYKGLEKSDDDITLASDVSKVKFAEGYIVWVTESDKVYMSKIGSKSSSYICSDFIRFIYDGDFVIKVENDDYIYRID